MVKEVEYKKTYRVNTHHPYGSPLMIGDLVEIKWIEPHGSVGYYDLEVSVIGERNTWAITNENIDIHCINKGKGVDNYGC